MIEGKIELWEQNDGEFKLVRVCDNMWVDDWKEGILDYFWGLEDWVDPAEFSTRWMGFGRCMFNNESQERASGMNGIPSGQECDYPVNETWLVNPEDSFLSREIGNRVKVTSVRRDQTVDITAVVDVPGDIPIGTEIREFATFLKSSGPFHDPSLVTGQHDRSMMTRAVLKGTGWYQCSGSTSVPCASGDSGAQLCYYDDPYEFVSTIKVSYKFGECGS